MNAKRLDVLADKANFADDQDEYSVISARGRKLGHYIKGQKRLFYQWRNINGHALWADVEVLTFDHATNYRTAKIYLIRGKDLEKVTTENLLLDLSTEAPTHIGKDVVKTLKEYCTHD